MARITLTLALVSLASVIALAAHAVAAKPSGGSVSRSLLARVNSGPDGRITRSITCTRVARGREEFACRLVSVRSTSLGAHVALVDGGLRETWQPLRG